ncbi:MAG: hypothetical protein Q4C95_07230 [Planctomycetia bacterium]|nr:hypothetical protein [Planctomycetia bacterium]
MNKLRIIKRRDFLQTVIQSAVIPPLFLSMSDSFQANEKSTDLCKYDPCLGDRLWMWGHGPNSTKGLYNIPEGHGIDMADAIRSMGIPNICVIRWLGLPAPDENAPNAPFDDYVQQFKNVKRVAWSVIDGAPQSYEQKKKWAFDLCQKMPNLVGFFLDDFYIDSAIPNQDSVQDNKQVSPAHLTLSQLEQFRREVCSLPHKTDISVVLYSHQLDPGIKYHIDLCDVVSFWTWHATNLVHLEDNFRRYRQIVPDKRTLLGVYMWDFGNGQPVTNELMKIQLEFALRKFREGEIEGLIFHCTPLCDMDLEAVNYSRKWIDENRNEVQS